MVGGQSRSRPPDSTSAPWLVFLHGKNNKCHQTFFSLTESRFYVRHIREISRNYWWASSRGWLLILEREGSSNCFLLNPMNMQRIELPPLVLLSPSDHLEYKLALSSSPADPDCVVMLINFDEQNIMFYHMGAHGDWILYKYSTMLLQENDYITEVVSANGRFYGCTFQDNIFLIEIVPCPRLTLVEMEKPISPPGFCLHSESLVESCGELYKVCRYKLLGTRIEADIRVYKMDTLQGKWCMVDNIGDRVFFLSTSSCSGSYSASELGLKGNCIYYLRPNDMCLYAFDMEEGTVLVDLPCPNVRPPWFRPFWIMPAV